MTPPTPDTTANDVYVLPLADPAATVELLFSRDGRFYYVTHLDHFTPREWVAVAPDPATGKYEVLDFASWDVRSGERRMVSETDPLVGRFALAARWPARGSREWVESALRVRASYVDLAESERQSLAFYERGIASITASLAQHAPHVAVPDVPTTT